MTVNIDDNRTELVLTIDDALGTQCSWRLTPELAEGLGNLLISKATTARSSERQEN